MVLHMALPTECHRNEVRNIVNIIYMQETLKGSEEARFKEKSIPQALKALTQGATQTPEWNL